MTLKDLAIRIALLMQAGHGEKEIRIVVKPGIHSPTNRDPVEDIRCAKRMVLIYPRLPK